MLFNQKKQQNEKTILVSKIYGILLLEFQDYWRLFNLGEQRSICGLWHTCDMQIEEFDIHILIANVVSRDS